jgi:hypothetical protein
MSNKSTVLKITLFALLVGMVAAMPAFAGSAVIGSVAGSMNASVGGQSLLPNTTIFSGDSLQVRDGVAVVAVGNNGRMVFGRDTVASFLRDANEITVVLSQGNVSVFHPADGSAVRVKVGNVSIAPAAGFKTLGEVAMLNGAVVVTAKEGALQVDDHGTTKNVAKGQTIVIAPKTADKTGGAGWGGGSTALEVGALGAGAAAAILAGIGISRADDAKTAADSATAAVTALGTSAGSAIGAATSEATAAASSAADALIIAECNYDWLQTGTLTSPVAGLTCPSGSNGGAIGRQR